MVRWIRNSVIGLVVVALLGGALVLAGWTVSETHFARPDAGFDREVARLEALPGARVTSSERWVEAPTFSEPQARVDVEVAAADLPGVLAATCAAEYPGPVAWSLVVDAGASTTVIVNDDIPATGSRCLDVGFDVAGIVEAAGALVPGVDLQPVLREDGSLALVAVDLEGRDIAGSLPLVAHADDLRDAAGLDADRTVQIDTMALGIAIGPGEHDRWRALVDGLVTEDGVTQLSADDADSQTDGVAKVQVAVPAAAHDAVEARIRASGLPVADHPVRFLPDDGRGTTEG
ncbi:hypothetical protein CMsap09_02975 [Clavibacter michiganensis]|uniref:Uncharacterized protein n=1 Tax=Clavibacter michiganensis TaxID=28447 RepID=A0A251XQV4_9MICO|nr:hypothetical protein CMsap09_02975 [Clavibacter michiganensis]